MTLEGFTPHDKQGVILNDILGGSEKYHVISVGRQFGKSLMGINLVLYWGFNEAPSDILWVSPVYSQTDKVQKQLQRVLEETPLMKSCNFTNNTIELVNGSKIVFRSAERYDNIRGWTFDYCVIDEAAYVRQEVWTEAVRPTLAVRGKKVLFLSTPSGRNWFYELYMLGVSDEHPNYKSYKGSSYDTPYIDREELEDARNTLPPNVFKQEYLAEFIEGGGVVFTEIDNCTFDEYPPVSSSIFCGIDLGKQEDFTVATFMNSSGEVVDIYRSNQRDWGYVIEDLIGLIKKYNARALIEVNSIGDVIYDELKGEVQVAPFITSNKTKQELIEGLILDFNEGNISIPSRDLFNPLYDELSVFTYDYSPKTRSIKYGHPKGFHDDCVISLALANYSRKTQAKRGQYNWVRKNI